jgi:hypothetical protein
MPGIVYESGPDRVSLDISGAFQQIGVLPDHLTPVPALKKVADIFISRSIVKPVGLQQGLH